MKRRITYMIDAYIRGAQEMVCFDNNVSDILILFNPFFLNLLHML